MLALGRRRRLQAVSLSLPALLTIMIGDLIFAAETTAWHQIDAADSRLDLSETGLAPYKFLSAQNQEGTNDYVAFPEGHVRLDIAREKGWFNGDEEALRRALKLHAQASKVAIDVDNLDIHHSSADLGPLIYAVYPSGEWTCVGFSINAGLKVPLIGGSGTDSILSGEFCKKGPQPKIADEELPHIRKIHLQQQPGF